MNKTLKFWLIICTVALVLGFLFASLTGAFYTVFTWAAAQHNPVVLVLVAIAVILLVK